MANCKKCGTPIQDGRIFCDKCKNDFGNSARKVFNDGADAFKNAEDFTKAYSAGDIESNKLYAALCYIPIICIFPILAKTFRSGFVRFHANQGLVLFILEIVISALFYALSLIPIAGKILSFPLYIASSFVNLVFLILIVYGAATAYMGLARVIPIIGKIRIFK